MTEGAALHLERLRTRAADFDPDVRDRLIAGAMLPGVWVAQAQKFRRRFRETALGVFRDVDVLIAPSTPDACADVPARRFFILDGEELLVRPNIGIFTQPISFIGLPVAAVPVWTDGRKAADRRADHRRRRGAKTSRCASRAAGARGRCRRAPVAAMD